jgi:hypothetical protein
MVNIKKSLQIAFHLFLAVVWTSIWYLDDLAENPGKTPDLLLMIPVAAILVHLFVQRLVLWVMIWIFFDLLFLLPVIAPVFRLLYDQTFIYKSVGGYLILVGATILLNVLFYLCRPREQTITPKSHAQTAKTAMAQGK